MKPATEKPRAPRRSEATGAVQGLRSSAPLLQAQFTHPAGTQGNTDGDSDHHRDSSLLLHIHGAPSQTAFGSAGREAQVGGTITRTRPVLTREASLHLEPGSHPGPALGLPGSLVAGTSFVTHRAQCKMKIWGPCFRIKNFNIATAEQVELPSSQS